MKLLPILALITATATAATNKVVTFEWDPSPTPSVTGYRFEQRIWPATNWITVGNVGRTNRFTLTVPYPAMYSWRVIATNWWADSDPSNEVATEQKPESARTNRIVSVITIEIP